MSTTPEAPASNTAERVTRVVHDQFEHFGLPALNVVPETHLVNDLEADSLDLLELVMALEEEFTVTISDEEIEASPPQTVADVIALVEKHLGATSPAASEQPK